MSNKWTIPTKEEQYFNWKTYLEHNLIVPGGLSIIVGDRNIGKTTGCFIDWIQRATTDEMIFYIRNTEKELKQYAKSFNSQYSNKYYMTASEIWTLERIDLYKKVKNEDGEVEEVFDKTEYRKKDVVGFCGALSGGDGWRSANFEKIKYIFSDEFNQIGNSLDFQKFITLWTSILRTKSEVFTVLMGNRDDASSDIIVELGIDILVPDNYKGDWVVPLLPESKEFKDKCFFIDLDDKRFTNNKKATIWKEIASTSITLQNYHNRGYKSYDNIDCKRLKNETMNKVDWLFSYDESNRDTIMIGKLQDLIVIHYLRPEEDFQAKRKYSDSLNTYTNKKYSKLLDDFDYFFYTIVNAAREHNIVYTSIAVKEDINSLLSDLAVMEDKKFFKL